MKNSLILVAAIMFFAAADALAGEYLKIGDVKNTWYTEPGSIDKAVISITPKGIFAECQLYLDFSVNCTSFNDPSDSLEIQMGFSLDPEAEVTDLWLWIDGIPVQAGIYDRWTASQVYEDIVGRRIDPALLLKNSDTEYELKVFPLMVNMPRKIKITFLIPLSSLTSSNSFVHLPFNILKLSSCPIDTTIIEYRPALSFDNPKITELQQTSFTLQTDTSGQYYSAVLSNVSNLSSLTLSLTNTAPASFFGAYFPNPNTGENIYQLELDIPQLLGIQASKKTLFLIDFVNDNSSMSSAQVLQTLENYVFSHFNAGDSINFMFSGFFTNKYSTSWLPADSTSLTQIFNTIDTNDMNASSNLPSLFIDGIDFIRTNGNDGSIVLISSSDDFRNQNTANSLIDDVISFMDTSKIPIHTINLDDETNSVWSGNTYYRANDYLYIILSTNTGGENQTVITYEQSYSDWWWWYYYEEVYHSFASMLNYVMPKLSGYFSALSVYATMQSGFTYSNYTIASTNGFVYYDMPYRQVGKYTGSFPMDIILAAQTTDGQLYSTQLTLNQTDVTLTDSMSQSIWAGQYLREMLSYSQTNSVVYQIVTTSINERVLTKYTAFLALEPGMQPPDTLAIPTFGLDGTVVPISIPPQPTETNTSDLQISFYPNPVSTIAQFSFVIEESTSVLIEVLSLDGQQIAVPVNKKYVAGPYIENFDASELPAGVYFYRVSLNNNIVQTGKFIVVD